MMTYRTEIIWLDLEDPVEDNLQIVASSGHSRFPVCQGSLDEVLGILLVKDLFARKIDSGLNDLSTLLQPPLFIPEAMRILNLLEQFKQQKDQIALVVDEYGGIVGLVTLNDVLVAIVRYTVCGRRTGTAGRSPGGWIIFGGRDAVGG
jgi:putative hemolysin